MWRLPYREGVRGGRGVGEGQPDEAPTALSLGLAALAKLLFLPKAFLFSGWRW